MRLTGERVTTPAGGFNPTWQRHVAAYRLADQFLTGDRVLDLGCGVGHSFEQLAGRRSVGLDLDLDALRGQHRPVVRADMRQIPLRSRAVTSVLSVQSLEHVPDPHRVVAETARVVEPRGTVVFVTPNRFTFGRPDEIIDPWHFVEYDAISLRELCAVRYGSVDVLGLFGSERYLSFYRGEMAKLDRLLRLDPLRLRTRLPRRVKQWGYSTMLERSRRPGRPVHPIAEHVTSDDFGLGSEALDTSLDLVAVCREPLLPRA